MAREQVFGGAGLGEMPDIAEAASDSGTGSEGGAPSLPRRSHSLESRQASQARQASGTLPGARPARLVGCAVSHTDVVGVSKLDVPRALRDGQGLRSGAASWHSGLLQASPWRVLFSRSPLTTVVLRLQGMQALEMLRPA